MKKLLSVFLCLMLAFAVVPICSVSAYVTPTLTLEKIIAKQGESVALDLSIANNPGIMAMTFCVSYDSDVLEYQGYEEGYLSNYNVKNHADKGLLSFVSIENSDKKDSDTMVTFLFKVKENAPLGACDLKIVNGNPDKYGASLDNSFADSKENFIVPTVENGTVEVISGSIEISNGDVNGDGAVNGRDYARLIQYINGWNVAIFKSSADVNNDNNINGRDYAYLLQYLNGWYSEI